METHNKYKPTHGGYPGKQIDLHCDDCTIDKMAIRHSEVCDQLNKKTKRFDDLLKVHEEMRVLLKKRIINDQSDELKARIDYVEAEWATQEARVAELETEVARYVKGISTQLDVSNMLLKQRDEAELSNRNKDHEIMNLEAELSRRKIEISLLEERLNPKPKWAEGVIAVDERRKVEPWEEGIYFYWYKDRKDPSPSTAYKGCNSEFSSDFIYQLVASIPTKPPQPKPL